MTNSVWNETTKPSPRPSLEGDITTDVLIIGGGMCGILLAHKLNEAGVQSVVVEAKTIGSGITKNTTAKITAQHGLIYADLIKRLGAEKARQYYKANTQAIKHYRALAEQYPCDFERKTAYIYSTNDRQKLENELDAYSKLGISSNIQENPPLPLETRGAIAMEGQAQFHPLKLLYALAAELDIYENTFVTQIDGLTAYTSNGKIAAQHIVLATHYPMVNIPGLYFLKLYQHRSYVVAMEGAPLVDGMYLDEQESGHSFRTYGNLLFVGGGDHRTGQKGGCYGAIESFVSQAYPNATEKYRWATQDCMTLDKIPYIGYHTGSSKSIYVATGFNKWGMTGSMVASEILISLLLTGESELEEIYSPQRSMMTGQLMLNIGAAAKGLLSFGAPRCAHMGCKLHWNSIEKTWDCSCHGSRFDESGHIIDNPAKKEIYLS